MGCGASSDAGQPGAKPTSMAGKTLSDPTGLISDVAFKLPTEDIQKSCGLALDIGSTVGKIVYRSNKDYKDGKPINPEANGEAHFAMFPRGDVQGMIKYIKEHCDLTPNAQGTIAVHSSGVGGVAFRKDIEAGLNCKMDIIPEFDCFCKAFLAIEKVLTPEEMIAPSNPELAAEGAAMKATMKEMEDKINAMTDVKAAVATDDVKDEDRSRLLIMAGSGTGILELKADGTFAMADGLYTAGRFMYGLASFLTGENDFSKLVELAEKGDGKTTDTFTSDLIVPSSEEADNVYDLESADTDYNMFAFGKGVTCKLEDAKKEDLVWSVFNATATIHAQIIAANIRLYKAKDVYFAGNVFNSELMRTMITRKKNEISSFLPTPVEYEYKFLKNGGMYGALGAYLNPPKAEEKTEEKTEDKTGDKTEEKTEEKTEDKTEQKTEEKTEENIVEKTEEKTEEKIR